MAPDYILKLLPDSKREYLRSNEGLMLFEGARLGLELGFAEFVGVSLGEADGYVESVGDKEAEM